MSFTSYTDLQASVANWLHRDDLTAQIPDFIAFAEFKLARELRVSPLVATNTLTIGANGDNAMLPALCMEVMAVREITFGNELRYVPPSSYTRIRAALTDLEMPLNYTVMSNALYVAPVWVGGGQLLVDFFRKETPLSTVGTNWYLTNAPDCLLYATLLQGAPFIDDAQTTQVWQAMYADAVTKLNAQYNVTQ